jgi:hypothetical protein
MHILCTLGVIEQGIILIFILLLTLLADMMHKFESFNPATQTLLWWIALNLIVRI